MERAMQIQENSISTEKASAVPQRIEIIDAARGFAVTLMVIHHALYNTVAFLGAPWWLFMNPVFKFLQVIFIGVFVIVSGISSRFSHRNIERGSIVLLIGIVISYVTIRIINVPILFGILCVLGTFMIFYGATNKLWDNIPEKTAICLYILLIILSTAATSRLSLTSDIPAVRDILYVLGWHQAGYVSHDYHPILPWIFVFLLGTCIGAAIKEGRFPQWFYDAKFPFFPLVGRNALAIYVMHQPVLFGIVMLIQYFQG